MPAITSIRLKRLRSIAGKTSAGRSEGQFTFRECSTPIRKRRFFSGPKNFGWKRPPRSSIRPYRRTKNEGLESSIAVRLARLLEIAATSVMFARWRSVEQGRRSIKERIPTVPFLVRVTRCPQAFPTTWFQLTGGLQLKPCRHRKPEHWEGECPMLCGGHLALDLLARGTRSYRP